MAKKSNAARRDGAKTVSPQNETAVEPLAYTPQDFAAAFRMSLTSTYEHMQAGNIRYIFIGSDRRIPRAEMKRIARQGLPKLVRETKAA